MKQQFLKKENKDNLILFFTGWGSDENLFNRDTIKGYDYMVCFDYSNLDFDYDIIAEYKKVTILAWSMGVWVANNILTDKNAKNINIDFKIAINGTLYPIDDNKGIPVNVFKSTLNSFSEKTLVKFRRRICGNTEYTKEFISHSPYRSIYDLKGELSALWRFVLSTEVKEHLKWDIAFIGISDKVFPYDNQTKAWKEVEDCKPIVLETGHYNPDLFNDLLLYLNKSKYLEHETHDR